MTAETVTANHSLSQPDSYSNINDALKPDADQKERVATLLCTLKEAKDLSEDIENFTYADLILIFNTRELLDFLIEKKFLAEYALYHETALQIVFANNDLTKKFLAELESKSSLPLYSPTKTVHPDEKIKKYVQLPPLSLLSLTTNKSNYDKASVKTLTLNYIAIIYPETVAEHLLAHDDTKTKLLPETLVDLGRNYPKLAAQIMNDETLKQNLPLEEVIPLSPANRAKGAILGGLIGLIGGFTIAPVVAAVEWIKPSNDSAGAIALSIGKLFAVAATAFIFPIALTIAAYSSLLYGSLGFIQGALGGLGAGLNTAKLFFMTEDNNRKYGILGEKLGLSKPRHVSSYFSFSFPFIFKLTDFALKNNIANQAEYFEAEQQLASNNKPEIITGNKKPQTTHPSALQECKATFKGVLSKVSNAIERELATCDSPKSYKL